MPAFTQLPADAQNEYLSETLGCALKADHSCRHVARIAHLYFVRVPRLTHEDFSQHLPALFDKIFGQIGLKTAEINQGGWLARNRCGASRDPPRRLAQQLQHAATRGQLRPLSDTFDVAKWDRDQQGAFRTFQLLDGFEEGNLFELCFRKPAQPFTYLFPVDRLPVRLRSAFKAWLNTQDPAPPPSAPWLLRVCSAGSMGRAAQQSFDAISLDLRDLFLFRFFDWFVNEVDGSDVANPWRKPKMRSSGSVAGSSAGVGASGSTALWAARVEDLVHCAPSLELFVRYCEYFLPTGGVAAAAAATAAAPTRVGAGGGAVGRAGDPLSLLVGTERDQALFVYAIAELWLNRNARVAPIAGVPGAVPGSALAAPTLALRAPGMFVEPNLHLLQALFILYTHLHNDPALRVDLSAPPPMGAPPYPQHLAGRGTSSVIQALRHALFDFLRTGIASSAASNAGISAKRPGVTAIVDLWVALLTPWKAALRGRDRSRGWGVGAAAAAARGAGGIPAAGDRGVVAGGAALASRFAALRSPAGAAAPDAGTRLLGGAESTPEQAAAAAAAAAATTAAAQLSAEFTHEWIWFVVQHYLFYSQLLLVFLDRFKDLSSDYEMACAARVFDPEHGPFGDCVLATLRACEEIVGQHYQQRPQRPLVQALPDLASTGRSADARGNFLSPQHLGGGGVLGAALGAGTPVLPTPKDVLLVLEPLREMVTCVIVAQYTELNLQPGAGSAQQPPPVFDPSRHPLPQLQGALSRPAAERVAQRLLAWPGVQQSTLGRLSRLVSAGGGPLTSKRPASKKLVLSRLKVIFAVDVSNLERSAVAGGASALAEALASVAKPPEAELAVGTPPWKRRNRRRSGHARSKSPAAKCVYRRLTAEGQRQLASGERVCTNAMAVGYIGDALLEPPPVCSYEVAALVPVLIALSLWLNELTAGVGANDPVFDEHSHHDATVAPPRESRMRINLRFLADVRLLVCTTLMLCLFGAFSAGACAMLSVLVFTAHQLRGDALLIAGTIILGLYWYFL